VLEGRSFVGVLDDSRNLFYIFPFQFANLYDHFENYQNYTTTAVAYHGQSQLQNAMVVGRLHGG
jgi:hypothetical protein